MTPSFAADNGPGNSSVRALTAAEAVEGRPLGPPLPPGVGTKVWTVPEFVQLWEAKYGRPMTPAERGALARGCIGITVVNLERGNINPPLDLAFGTFRKVRSVQRALNDILATDPTREEFARRVHADPMLSQLDNVVGSLPAGRPSTWTAVVFSKRFYSKQNPDWTDERADRAFRPDPATGQVDMSEYRYRARPGYVNFDYGWLDEGTGTWWHANRAEPGMEVYQSTLADYSRPLLDFDRQTFNVAFSRSAS